MYAQQNLNEVILKLDIENIYMHSLQMIQKISVGLVINMV